MGKDYDEIVNILIENKNIGIIEREYLNAVRILKSVVKNSGRSIITYVPSDSTIKDALIMRIIEEGFEILPNIHDDYGIIFGITYKKLDNEYQRILKK